MATRIYIDQGHNPVNPNAGAEGSGYREQDLVFRIGSILSDILSARGFETRLSRPSPSTILGTSNLTSLQARVNDANAWGADYFISLHTNASSSSSASGSEALVYRADSTAYDLAEEILFRLSLNTGLSNRGILLRPGLYVLRKTRMPAVLIELGFITNSYDAELMAGSPELFASGVADGISEYLLLANAVSDASISLPASVFPDTISSDDSATLDEFLAESEKRGDLKIQAFKARQAFPVSKLRISVSKKFSDGEHVFFDGETDENGLIDPIPLPSPPLINSLSSLAKNSAAYYTVRAYSPEYEDITRVVEIFEGIKTIQPLALIPRAKGGDI